jgi:hypothetical protein
VSERRCGHGFLRSVVACPACDLGKARFERETSERTGSVRSRTRHPAAVVQREGSYRCRACGVEKPLTEYYISRTSRLGHQSRCKVCDNNKRSERLRAAS